MIFSMDDQWFCDLTLMNDILSGWSTICDLLQCQAKFNKYLFHKHIYMQTFL